MIQQGMAFNGKRTKTARSQGKKFQVSVEQEATRLLGNLGWALMQQNNYKEAEDAYRRALLIAPDNNKMCNLGICLMKQGRIAEAKETLRRVKQPVVADGPRGVDSHLKAYERAQQMLLDLESEIMNKGGGDWVEQRRLFDKLLSSSSIWQPQPCKDHSTKNSFRAQDEFPDENINSNIVAQKCLNIDARPFYSSKLSKDPIGNYPFHERLKRTRSGNAANSIRANEMGEFWKPPLVEEPDNKTRRRSISPEKKTAGEERWADVVLPDSKDFEEAIIAAVLGSGNETEKKEMETTSSCPDTGMFHRKIDKRLKVFQDITLSLSPKGLNASILFV
ncbi:hypothetical protein U1Q18_040064 [Sarracenia purpurea var. burkii]